MQFVFFFEVLHGFCGVLILPKWYGVGQSEKEVAKFIRKAPGYVHNSDDLVYSAFLETNKIKRKVIPFGNVRYPWKWN